MRSIRSKYLQFCLVCLLGLPTISLLGQNRNISLRLTDQPLSDILVQIRNAHAINVTFDHTLLSSFRVTADTTVRSTGDALDFLLNGLPLKWKTHAGGYIIYPVKPASDTPADPVQKPEYTTISGRIIDGGTRETLPYSHIRWDSQVLVSDPSGNFTIRSESGTPLAVTISYLGYHSLDTVIRPGPIHMIELQPARIGLQNVVILSDSTRLATPVTSHPGEVRLNPRISAYLPGNGDHSLFNVLRLQPGILAAGEQANDLIIWGSYEGQSQVIFDGFTLYGLKNFNDQISAVNPLLVKDIRVLKGGFEPRYGNRVGGIVDITGYQGSKENLHGDFIINNLTINGMITGPVAKSSSLTLAFRNTYYNLYKNIGLQIPFKTRAIQENPVDFAVAPDYRFRDINLKYSGFTRRGDQFNLHLLYGTDSFSYQVEIPGNNYRILDTLQERNRQQGISGNYQHRWKSGASSTFTTSYSGIRNDLSNQIEVTRRQQPPLSRNSQIDNQLNDFSFKVDNRFSASSRNLFEFGTGLNIFGVALREIASGAETYQSTSTGWLGNLYVQDRLTISPSVLVQFGMRADLPSAVSRLYIQPRASLEWEISPVFRIKGAIGKYNQFIVKSAAEDDAGNIRYFWNLADNIDIPVVSSRHLAAGGYFDWSHLQVHAEAWIKTYDGITRFRAANALRDASVVHGEGRGAGIDLYVQKQIGRHSGWIAYSLSRTTEHFPDFQLIRYVRAPQDQTHEIKMAVLLDFSPVYFSAGYVYGSGFPVRTQILAEQTVRNYPYSRLDASLTYRLKIRKAGLETGISVLNLLNTQNIKISNFVRIPVNSLTAFNIQAEAIPFTPTLYLKVSF